MRTPHNRAALVCAAVAAVMLPGVAREALGTAKVYNPTSASDTWNLDSNWGVLSGGAGSSVIPNQGIPVATSRTATDSGDSADFRLEGVSTLTDPIVVDTGADQAVTALRFQGTALPAGQSYTINNNTITLYGLNNGNGVVYQISSQVTINSNLRIVGDQFFFSGGAGGAGITYNGAISEGGASYQLTRNQSGIATFTNPNNSFTGGLVVTDGTLRATNDGALGAPYDGTLSRLNVQAAGSGYTAAPTITITGGGGTGASGTATLSGATVGSFNLTSPGSGYTSLPTITTSNGAARAFATIKGQVTVKTGGTLTLSGTFDSNRPFLLGSNASGFGAINTAFSNTLSGVLSNANGFAVASLTKQGSGTLTLTNANLYNGGTTISAGTLRINSDAALGAAYDGSVVGVFVNNGGSGYTSPAAVTLNGTGTGATATVTVGSGTNAGIITGTSLTAGGTGYVYPPTSTITGSGGSGSGASLTSYVKGLLTIKAGGTLQMIAPVTSNRAVVLAAGTGASTIDTNGFDSTFTGVLNNGPSGTGAFTKAGAGTLTLTGANTYTGLTSVTGGTLRLGPAAWGPVLSSVGADVKAGEIDFDYTNTGTTAASPASSVFSQIAGGVIKTSNASATTTVGMLDNGSAVRVMYTYYGDANLDGKVDADDYALVDRGFAAGLTGWANGDLNYDGAVNQNDYLLMDTAYAAGGIPQAAFSELMAKRMSQFGDAYVVTLLTSVPEPSALAVMAAPLVLGLRRRRGARR